MTNFIQFRKYIISCRVNAYSLTLHIDISFLITDYDIHFDIVMKVIDMFAYHMNENVYILLWGIIKFR